jgi:hypothetical protein
MNVIYTRRLGADMYVILVDGCVCDANEDGSFVGGDDDDDDDPTIGHVLL